MCGMLLACIYMACSGLIEPYAVNNAPHHISQLEFPPPDLTGSDVFCFVTRHELLVRYTV